MGISFGPIRISGFTAAIYTPPTYIEDVFSTWLYTGNGTSQTITNGINLSDNGGLVWIKCRTRTYDHILNDTTRGAGYGIFSDTTDAQYYDNSTLTSFSSSGFNLGQNNGVNQASNTNYVSWTFRKQPKFFDVVTYTGNGGTLTVSHNLGSTPGCIIVKKTSGAADWYVWHKSLAASNANYSINLNTTSAATLGAVFGGSSLPPTSTNFSVGPGVSVTNGSGETYVAYLFASDAGGFGATGTDNVITCGSFTSDGSGNANVSLGYEPQWVLIKGNATGEAWYVTDTMRGMPVTPATNSPFLRPNSSAAEGSWGSVNGINATGWNTTGLAASTTYIYIAIRRGPMKTPTDATKVFAPVTYTGNGTSQSITAGFPIDLAWFKIRNAATNSFEWFDRLRGAGQDLRSAYTYAEITASTEVTSFASNTQVALGASSDTGGTNSSGSTYVLDAFQRAPSFFDEVCYTGTSTAQNVNHNLGVAPELMIIKRRDSTIDWGVYSKSIPITQSLLLDTNNAAFTPSAPGYWNGTNPTSSVFSLSTALVVNGVAGATFVAYLFATCAGVSKVGSYTGNGTTQTIDCGFAGGARFVLIKRTDSTGDWYVYDTARGMTTLTDPYLLLNTTAAETATLGSVTTVTTGFALNSTILAAINASGGTYIFLAIA
jgi:hypothetical protein